MMRAASVRVARCTMVTSRVRRASVDGDHAGRLAEMRSLAAIETTGELVEDVASPHARLPGPTRLPHGLPHELRILDDSHFAQRKPMP
jgi:hypothetical protein